MATSDALPTSAMPTIPVSSNSLDVSPTAGVSSAIPETQTVSPTPFQTGQVTSEHVVRIKIDELRLRLAEMQNEIGGPGDAAASGVGLASEWDEAARGSAASGVRARAWVAGDHSSHVSLANASVSTVEAKREQASDWVVATYRVYSSCG